MRATAPFAWVGDGDALKRAIVRSDWTNQAFHCPAYNGLISWVAIGENDAAEGSYSYNLWGAARDGGHVTSTPYYGLGVDYEAPDRGLTARTVAQIVAPSQLYALMDTKENIAPVRGQLNGYQLALVGFLFRRHRLEWMGLDIMHWLYRGGKSHW